LDNILKDYTAFFNTFGYDTDAGCDICGAKPCKTEPRFGYTTCKTHCIISPLEFSQTREGIIKDTTKNEDRQRDAERSNNDDSTVGREIPKGWLV